MRYEVIIKKCPVCKNPFNTKKGHKREKTTCSYSCSNTFFSNRRNKPSKYKFYRTICFKHHKKECIICKENLVVGVHHYDGNHDNNIPENLMPLCPTHHHYWHSKHRYLIIDKVNQYRNEFIAKQTK